MAIPTILEMWQQSGRKSLTSVERTWLARWKFDGKSAKMLAYFRLKSGRDPMHLYPGWAVCFSPLRDTSTTQLSFCVPMFGTPEQHEAPCLLDAVALTQAKILSQGHLLLPQPPTLAEFSSMDRWLTSVKLPTSAVGALVSVAAPVRRRSIE